MNDGSGMTASTLLQENNQAKLALSTSKDAQDDKKTKESDTRPNKKAKKEDVQVDTKAQFEPFMTEQCSLNSTEKLDVFHGVIPVVTNASSEYVTVVNSETSSGVDSLHVTDTSDLLPSGLKIMIYDHQSKLLSKMSDPLPGKDSGVPKERSLRGAENKKKDDTDDSMDDFPEIVDEEPDEEDRMP